MNAQGAPTNSRRFFLTLALSCITVVALVFSLWELVEHHYFRDLNYRTLHYLYITRGIASSLMIGLWATWFVLRERRHREEQLQQSYEYYRSILNHMPEAAVLFDQGFRLVELNETAERLFGLDRKQALGKLLPTIPTERWAELQAKACPSTCLSQKAVSTWPFGRVRAQATEREEKTHAWKMPNPSTCRSIGHHILPIGLGARSPGYSTGD